MNTEEQMDKLIKEDYQKVQSIGLRIKILCIKCNQIYDLDQIEEAIKHNKEEHKIKNIIGETQ